VSADEDMRRHLRRAQETPGMASMPLWPLVEQDMCIQGVGSVGRGRMCPGKCCRLVERLVVEVIWTQRELGWKRRRERHS
jgi:hypothetical protein